VLSAVPAGDIQLTVKFNMNDTNELITNGRYVQVGQNHMYTVYTRYLLQKLYRIYGVCVYVLANPRCLLLYAVLVLHSTFYNRVGQNRIYLRCINGIIGREITNNTVIYGVHIYGSGRPNISVMSPPMVNRALFCAPFQWKGNHILILTCLCRQSTSLLKDLALFCAPF
jgi:hypothetical protein